MRSQLRLFRGKNKRKRILNPRGWAKPWQRHHKHSDPSAWTEQNRHWHLPLCPGLAFFFEQGVRRREYSVHCCPFWARRVRGRPTIPAPTLIDRNQTARERLGRLGKEPVFFIIDVPKVAASGAGPASNSAPWRARRTGGQEVTSTQGTPWLILLDQRHRPASGKGRIPEDRPGQPGRGAGSPGTSQALKMIIEYEAGFFILICCAT